VGSDHTEGQIASFKSRFSLYDAKLLSKQDAVESSDALRVISQCEAATSDLLG